MANKSSESTPVLQKVQCENCKNTFSKKSNLVRHLRKGKCSVVKEKTKNGATTSAICEYCGQIFSRKYDFTRHLKNGCPRLKERAEGEGSTSLECEHCKHIVSRKYDLVYHMKNGCSALKRTREDDPPTTSSVAKKARMVDDRVRINVPTTSMGDGVDKLHSAFKNRIVSFRFSSKNTHINYKEFCEEVKEKVFDVMQQYVEQYKAVKINFEAFGLYMLPEKELSDMKSFNTKNVIFTEASDRREVYEQIVESITTRSEEFQEKDSGWALKQVTFLDVNINKYTPMTASSYVKLPTSIVRKKAVLNIRNEDNACFAWCVMAGLFPPHGNPAHTTSYPDYRTVLNFTGIDFPMKLKDIGKSEKQNIMSVNVFGVETEFRDGKNITEIVGPLHFTSQRQHTHINLLLISDADTSTHHYCLITNLSRLVTRQKSKHNGGIHVCDGCLQSFAKVDGLRQHRENDCTYVCTKLPTTEATVNKYGESVPENKLKFINFEKQLSVPFVIYADFESLLKPIDHSEPCDNDSFTVKVADDDRYSKFETYRGPNTAEVFIEKLDNTVHELYNTHFKNVQAMKPLSQLEKIEYENADTCHICKKSLNVNTKVRDHCHLTGLYRGPAHSVCNLNYKIPTFVPVFFHNLNYDTSLFIKKLTAKEEDVFVVAQTKEKYISYTKSILVDKSNNPKIPDKYFKLRFVDSFRFLSKSLDKLSQTLEVDQCIETRRQFPEQDEFDLIRQKGVFPYDYVNCYEKLKETEIPSKEQFYNCMASESVSDKDYARALKVWNTFKCGSLGEYADLYLKSDVLLLADVFENFRKVCLEQYKLDPAHYLTAPSLSWDAMLRYTQVELELLTDIDTLHFFRKGIRGGVSQCSKRKCVANNSFLKNHDPSKPTSYILYLDATNLYGAAMKESLPSGDFRWLKKDEIESFDCTSIKDDSSKGYVLEVDLKYPIDIHNDHNDLPFCAEQMTPPNSKTSKLIPNLYDKSNYIIHIRNLKQCLKYGLKLKKVHRVLEFTQSPWLGTYIDLNTKLRNSAKNEFEKDLFKLMVNSIFGKTMENVDKRRNIKICSRWENKNSKLGARSLIAMPHFQSCSVFEENLVAIQLQKTKVMYDKPLYVGFSILEISKTFIYEFLYGYIKPVYGDRAVLLYTDTDSLVIEIYTENPYKDMQKHIEYFDTSNYDVDNIHNMPRTKSVVGKMKDEYGGRILECFYGTGAKCYCIKSDDVLKKAKGISKSVTNKELHLADYEQVVEKGGKIYRKMYIFKSTLHTIYTELKNKIALSSVDDKRHIDADGVNTTAWGHYRLDKSTVNLESLLKEAETIVRMETECAEALTNGEFDFDLE